MEIDELDAWYDEEKEKAFDKYMKELEETGDHEKPQSIFLQAMQQLRDKYRLEYEQIRNPTGIKKMKKQLKDIKKKFSKG